MAATTTFDATTIVNNVIPQLLNWPCPNKLDALLWAISVFSVVVF